MHLCTINSARKKKHTFSLIFDKLFLNLNNFPYLLTTKNARKWILFGSLT